LVRIGPVENERLVWLLPASASEIALIHPRIAAAPMAIARLAIRLLIILISARTALPDYA
jgi:hypothetical protein